jgi:chromosome segregation ATPase
MGEVHTGIQRQLQDQGAQLSELAVEVTRARMGVESMEARVAALERSAAAMRWLAVAALVGLAGAIGLLLAVLERLRAH